MTDQTSAADALKPCPFCGGEAQDYGQVEIGGAVQTRIGCKDCGARSPVWGEGNTQHAWNTRAAAPQEVDIEDCRKFFDDWFGPAFGPPEHLERIAARHKKSKEEFAEKLKQFIERNLIGNAQGRG